MKDNEKIIIDGVEYQYCASYDRLELPDFQDGTAEVPAIRCPKCHGMEFRIGYGNWCCIAFCKCGHQMDVYDG